MRWLYQPLLLLLASSTDSDLAEQVEYLRAENRILRAKLGKRPYRFTLPASLRELRAGYAGLALEARTVHAAKGLEADYVVILDVTPGRFGFPTEVSDDSVLGLVLAQADTFPNAEERRLFYVALNRARRRPHIVTDEGRRSAFVDEMEREAYGTVTVHVQTGAQLSGTGDRVEAAGEGDCT